MLDSSSLIWHKWGDHTASLSGMGERHCCSLPCTMADNADTAAKLTMDLDDLIKARRKSKPKPAGRGGKAAPQGGKKAKAAAAPREAKNGPKGGAKGGAGPKKAAGKTGGPQRPSSRGKGEGTFRADPRGPGALFCSSAARRLPSRRTGTACTLHCFRPPSIALDCRGGRGGFGASRWVSLDLKASPTQPRGCAPAGAAAVALVLCSRAAAAHVWHRRRPLCARRARVPVVIASRAHALARCNVNSRPGWPRPRRRPWWRPWRPWRRPRRWPWQLWAPWRPAGLLRLRPRL